MERPSRGSRVLSLLEKRHGLEPAHSAEEHWIAKAHRSYVENPHLEMDRSPWVRSVDRLGPNVKVQPDSRVEAHRDLHCAQNYLTDVDRDSGPHQSRWNGFRLPMRAGSAAFPVKPKEYGLSPQRYPDGCRWPVDVERIASQGRPKTLSVSVRSLVRPCASCAKLAYWPSDPWLHGYFPEAAARYAGPRSATHEPPEQCLPLAA
jgi:hypothetical protein